MKLNNNNNILSYTDGKKEWLAFTDPEKEDEIGWCFLNKKKKNKPATIITRAHDFTKESLPLKVDVNEAINYELTEWEIRYVVNNFKRNIILPDNIKTLMNFNAYLPIDIWLKIFGTFSLCTVNKWFFINIFPIRYKLWRDMYESKMKVKEMPTIIYLSILPENIINVQIIIKINNFDKLPSEVINSILNELDYDRLILLKLTNKKFNNIIGKFMETNNVVIRKKEQKHIKSTYSKYWDYYNSRDHYNDCDFEEDFKEDSDDNHFTYQHSKKWANKRLDANGFFKGY